MTDNLISNPIKNLGEKGIILVNDMNFKNCVHFSSFIFEISKAFKHGIISM